MSELGDIHAAIATYVGAIPSITRCEYPAPNSITANNTAVVYAGDFQVTLGMSNELKVLGTSRVVLYIAPTDTANAISRADDVALVMVDQFSQNGPGFHLNGLVDYCQVTRVELSRVYEYAGHTYFGATFYLETKLNRFAGVTYTP
jgi:hypothetical protein